MTCQVKHIKDEYKEKNSNLEAASIDKMNIEINLNKLKQKKNI